MVVGLLIATHIFSNIIKFVARTIRFMATGGQDISSMECECDSTISHKHNTSEPEIIVKKERNSEHQPELKQPPSHSKKEVSKKVKPRKSKRDRLETFINMPTPHHVTPNLLAKHGFVYSRKYKACVCDECLTVVKKWNIGDKPDDAMFHRPPCRFARTRAKLKEPPVLPSESDDMEIAATMGNINHSQISPFQSVPVLVPSTSNAQLASMPALPIDTTCNMSVKSTSDSRLTPIEILQSRPTPPQRHTPPSNHTSHRGHLQGLSNNSRRPDPASIPSMVDQPATSHYGIPNPRPRYHNDADVDVRDLDMRDANNRLATFEKYWPSTSTFLNIMLLASCGFFCMGQGDAVQCFACHQVVSNWNRDDDPWRRHSDCSPHCRFLHGGHTADRPLVRRDVKRSSSQSVPRGQRTAERQQSITPSPSSRGAAYIPSAEEIERTIWRSQYLCRDPHNPAMREELARLNTFNSAEFRNTTRLEANDLTLVRAGMYYLGHGDSTKCWFCGGGLRDFLPGDDPWVEHAKYFPECEHLLRERGPMWVREIVQRFPNEARPPLPVRANQAAPNDQPGSAGAQMLINAMRTNPVIDAIRMGFDEQLIRDAQRRQIESTGNFFQTSEELIEALVGPEEPPPLPQGNNVSIRGGNFIGPNIVNGRLLGDGNGNLVGQVLINGVPIQDYMDAENVANDQAGVVFNNNGGVVSANLEERANADLDSCAPSSSSPVLTGTPEQQLETLKKEYQCKICYSKPVDVLFQPCGHVSTCVQCAKQLNSCPICRKRISKKLRAFHS